MKTPDIISALNPVIKTFEKLNVSYYIGGSVASSIYGMARSTLDVDIVADIQKFHTPLLMAQLQGEYYIDEDMIKEAIQHHSSFNLIHLATAIKIDIFIYTGDPHQQKTFERRLEDRIVENQDNKYFFPSPEDIIIIKLQWFDMGKRISERQWLDILGVIKLQGKSLDIKYLQSWSLKLGFDTLLLKALMEAGFELEK